MIFLYLTIFLTKSQIYTTGLIIFALILFLISLENSLLYKITSYPIYHSIENILLNAYLFSAIALLVTRKLTYCYPYLKNYGDFLLLFSIILSLFFGYIITYLIKKLKNIEYFDK